MDCSMPDFPVYHQLPEFTQTHVHQVGDDIQPSHPLSPPSPPTFNLSQHQGLFQRVSSSHQMAKELEFQLQDQTFQWIFRTDSFRIDWFYLLAVQGTLKSLLQHHSSKASILQHSDFFIVHLSHPCMTTGKTIALTRWALYDPRGKIFLFCVSSMFYTAFKIAEIIYTHTHTHTNILEIANIRKWECDWWKWLVIGKSYSHMRPQLLPL